MYFSPTTASLEYGARLGADQTDEDNRFDFVFEGSRCWNWAGKEKTARWTPRLDVNVIPGWSETQPHLAKASGQSSRQFLK